MNQNEHQPLEQIERKATYFDVRVSCAIGSKFTDVHCTVYDQFGVSISKHPLQRCATRCRGRSWVKYDNRFWKDCEKAKLIPWIGSELEKSTRKK